MHTIVVTETLVTPCFIAAEMGEMLYQILSDTLHRCDRVELDFSGYHYISESFFYHSIGKLCLVNRWTERIFREKVVVSNLMEDDAEDLESILQNVQIQLSLGKI